MHQICDQNFREVQIVVFLCLSSRLIVFFLSFVYLSSWWNHVHMLDSLYAREIVPRKKVIPCTNNHKAKFHYAPIDEAHTQILYNPVIQFLGCLRYNIKNCIFIKYSLITF